MTKRADSGADRMTSEPCDPLVRHSIMVPMLPPRALTVAALLLLAACSDHNPALVNHTSSAPTDDAVTATRLSGIVRVSQGKSTDWPRPKLQPTVGTGVQLVAPGTGKIIARTTTDKKGRYLLSAKSGSYIVVVTPASVFLDCRNVGPLILGSVPQDGHDISCNIPRPRA